MLKKALTERKLLRPNQLFCQPLGCFQNSFCFYKKFRFQNYWDAYKVSDAALNAKATARLVELAVPKKVTPKRKPGGVPNIR